MKYIFLMVPMLFLPFFMGCNGVKVITDFDQEVDFTQYKTYAWSPTEDPLNKDYPQFDNSLNRKRWKDAVDEALQRQGFVLGEGEVDIEVDFHLQFSHNAVPYHDYQDLEEDPYHYRPTSVYQYDRGTVIIHLLDLEQKRIVWQGISTRVLDVELLEDAEANIQKAVNKIFKKFPV